MTFSSNYRHCPYPGDVDDPTYRFLQRLPTNPQALLRLIERESKGSYHAQKKPLPRSAT